MRFGLDGLSGSGRRGTLALVAADGAAETPVSAADETSTGHASASYVGRGIYDIKEVARLLRRSTDRVSGWACPSRGRPSLLTGELGGLFSFWDLISLRVIAELTRRKVRRADIARGAQYLANQLDTVRPFAHEGLATVGEGFFAELDGRWEDAGQRGQLAFQSMVKPLLDPIMFDDEHMAAIWRPHEGVWINPAVQAGAPCVEGTRVPTYLLARQTGPGERGITEACDDYRLTARQVCAARQYEAALAA